MLGLRCVNCPGLFAYHVGANREPTAWAPKGRPGAESHLAARSRSWRSRPRRGGRVASRRCPGRTSSAHPRHHDQAARAADRPQIASESADLILLRHQRPHATQTVWGCSLTSRPAVTPPPPGEEGIFGGVSPLRPSTGAARRLVRYRTAPGEPRTARQTRRWRRPGDPSRWRFTRWAWTSLPVHPRGPPGSIVCVAARPAGR